MRSSTFLSDKQKGNKQEKKIICWYENHICQTSLNLTEDENHSPCRTIYPKILHNACIQRRICLKTTCRSQTYRPQSLSWESSGNTFYFSLECLFSGPSQPGRCISRMDPKKRVLQWLQGVCISNIDIKLVIQ